MLTATKDEDHPKRSAQRKGRLIVGGMGTNALAHLTVETIAHIRNAEVVFFCAFTGVSANYIRSLNSNAIDLQDFCVGLDESAPAACIQAAELILKEVRCGRYVVGLFNGHPAIAARTVHRALTIARIEAHIVQILPGISTLDCLFADLHIDPTLFGVQILTTSQLLRSDTVIATTNHLILLPASATMHTGNINDRPITEYLHDIFRRLVGLYGAQQELVCYVPSVFPGFSPQIHIQKLAHIDESIKRHITEKATLYLPPLGTPLSSLAGLQGFDNIEPYNDYEVALIQELNFHIATGGLASSPTQAMMNVMTQLADSPSALFRYKSSPETFLADHTDLRQEEVYALQQTQDREIHALTCRPSTRSVRIGSSTNTILNHKDTRHRVQSASIATRLPPTLDMHWSPARQTLRFDDHEFVHDGPIATHPSHDLAHLMIAANGRLLWAPDGARDENKLAEYNAVFLENILSNAYHCVITGRSNLQECVNRALAHARWFVEKHYSPFPISFGDAQRAFSKEIDVSTIAFVSPYFFDLKTAEHADDRFRSKSWRIEIDCANVRIPFNRLELDFQAAVRLQLVHLKTG